MELFLVLSDFQTELLRFIIAIEALVSLLKGVNRIFLHGEIGQEGLELGLHLVADLVVEGRHDPFVYIGLTVEDLGEQ